MGRYRGNFGSRSTKHLKSTTEMDVALKESACVQMSGVLLSELHFAAVQNGSFRRLYQITRFAIHVFSQAI